MAKIAELMATMMDAGQSMGHTGAVGDPGEKVGGPGNSTKKKSRNAKDSAAIKRRCVSTACIACRKRKSKCDGNTPSCAACSSVYGTGEHCTSLGEMQILVLTTALL